TGEALGAHSRAHGPKHAVEVRVGEAAFRIESRTYLLESIPLWVARRECLRRLEVKLAPVRAAAVVIHDVLDGFEVLLVLHALEDVDGDLSRIATAGGAERNLIAGCETHFDREDR